MKCVRFALTFYLCMILSNRADSSLLSTETLDIVPAQKSCTYNDAKCMKKVINILYPKLVSGLSGATKPSDPLTLDTVTIDLPTSVYIGHNATLTGLLSCVVKELTITPENGCYKFVINCPSLNIVVLDYVANGFMNEKHVVGAGTSKITLDNNVLTLTGFFTTFLDKDNKIYNDIANMALHMTTKKVKCTFTGLVYGDQEESGDWKAISEADLKQYEEIIRKKLMERFITEFRARYNKGLTITPMNDVLSGV